MERFLITQTMGCRRGRFHHLQSDEEALKMINFGVRLPRSSLRGDKRKVERLFGGGNLDRLGAWKNGPRLPATEPPFEIGEIDAGLGLSCCLVRSRDARAHTPSSTRTGGTGRRRWW